jgi:hypothetical protein
MTTIVILIISIANKQKIVFFIRERYYILTLHKYIHLNFYKYKYVYLVTTTTATSIPGNVSVYFIKTNHFRKVFLSNAD